MTQACSSFTRCIVKWERLGVCVRVAVLHVVRGVACVQCVLFPRSFSPRKPNAVHFLCCLQLFHTAIRSPTAAPSFGLRFACPRCECACRSPTFVSCVLGQPCWFGQQETGGDRVFASWWTETAHRKARRAGFRKTRLPPQHLSARVQRFECEKPLGAAPLPCVADCTGRRILLLLPHAISPPRLSETARISRDLVSVLSSFWNARLNLDSSWAVTPGPDLSL